MSKPILIILFLFLTTISYAATYYVDQTGGLDTNNGISNSTPWKSLVKVVAFDKVTGFLPGDNISFKKGEKWRETLQCWSSGEAGKYITYTSYGSGDEPIIDGSDIVADWTDEGNGTWSNSVYNEPAQIWEDNVRLTYKDYQKSEAIDGVGQFGYDAINHKILIRCTDDANPNTHIVEVGARNVSCWISHNDETRAKNNNHHIILENITFQKTAGTYSYGTGGSQMIDSNGDILIYQIMISQGHHIIVRNLITRQCGGGRPFYLSEAALPTVWAANIEFWRSPYSEMYNVTAYDGATILLNMETLMNDGEYYIMHDCIGYNAWNVGIGFGGGECYNNTVYDIGSDVNKAYRCGFWQNGVPRVVSNIYNNNFNNCRIGVWFYGDGSDSYATNIKNNLFTNCVEYLTYIQTGTRNFNFYNNTWTTTGTANGIFIGSDGITVNYNLDFKNNIIKVADGYCFRKNTGQDTYNADYNLFYRGTAGSVWIYNGINYTYAQLANYKIASGQDTHSISGDPLLNSNYTLKAISPCIDAGVNIKGLTDDYLGHLRPEAEVDIGAYEYVATTPDITAPSAVSNISVTGATMSTASLRWTSSGDDGASGTAASYDIRYNTQIITDSNWGKSTQVSAAPVPQVAGSIQTMTVTGLTSVRTYYFAMKASDEVPNTSGLSNVASGTTSAVPDTTPPYTTGHDPAKNSIKVALDENIVVHVKDDGSGVDINTIVMRVNGVVVTPTITGTPADYTLTYDPSVDFAIGQTVIVTVDASDLGQ
ncbi:MAG: hypothetical protein KJ915_03145 [Candidatus Omnitrophica bacterium]|nr:hypothetical protein [Candidatus Omnitrophota bacterium]